MSLRSRARKRKTASKYPASPPPGWMRRYPFQFVLILFLSIHLILYVPVDKIQAEGFGLYKSVVANETKRDTSRDGENTNNSQLNSLQMFNESHTFKGPSRSLTTENRRSGDSQPLVILGSLRNNVKDEIEGASALDSRRGPRNADDTDNATSLSSRSQQNLNHPIVRDMKDVVAQTPNGIFPREGLYAYAFVVGGCGPELPSYRNYIYDILIATNTLREDGSRADVVAFFQMHGDSNATELPSHEVRWLKAMGIKVYYISKAEAEQRDSFYSISLQKFRILGLTQYKRILFLDADVLPLGNLDYMFEMSDAGILKENFIVPAIGSPANAGFFMVTPYRGALDDVNKIVRKTEQRNNRNSKTDFDKVKGWGHTIKPPDRWEKIRGGNLSQPFFNSTTGTLWQFAGASADQGLLLHFTKYFRKQVSIVFGNKVQNWGPSGPGETVTLEDTLRDPFRDVRPAMYRGLVDNCENFSPAGCPPPLCDFEHFNSPAKPWVVGPPEEATGLYSEANRNKTALHLWFNQLAVLNNRLQMGLDDQLVTGRWNPTARAPLGPKPVPEQNRGARTNLANVIREA